MNGIQEFLFGPPTSGSNDPDISKFLANQEASRNNQRKDSSNLQDGPVELPSYGDEMESPSMQGLLKYNYAEADATGVAHDGIDGILAGNRQDKLEKMIRTEGSIRATPYLETAEGKQTIMDIAMGSAFPGAAIGRTTKAAITGGQGIINNMPKKLVDEALEQGGFKGLTSQVNWNNKLNSTRLLMEKALSKWGVDDRARKLMDPISEMLRTSKYKQN